MVQTWFKWILLMFAACICTLIFFLQPHPCITETCSDGRLCPAHYQCCEQGCCPAGFTATVLYEHWPAFLLLLSLAGFCIFAWTCFCLRGQRGHEICCPCCFRRPTSEHDSAGSLYLPPRYSRCGSFHQAPPPYSEVTSKPDLYPLVITCGEGEGKAGGNYLMVHYFRNYVIRAPGSLSATSTTESLNSSFCNAANEGNLHIPPPYSCTSNSGECGGGGCGLLRSLSSLTERPPRRPDRPRRDMPSTFRENLITSPVQPLDPSFDLELEMIDCEMYCDGACKPHLGPSPPVHRSPSNMDDIVYDREYAMRHLYNTSPDGAGTCESPPQPTSPTQSKDSTLRRSTEERCRRIESVMKKARKSSLYMPLSVAYPVRISRASPEARVPRHAVSRSAPATPCGSLVPNLLNFTQRVSTSRQSRSSRLDEECNRLLMDDNTRADNIDHKF